MLKKIRIMGVFVLLLVITIPSSAASFSAPTSQENISIETIERPFFRNVTDITHSDGGMVYVGTDGNGLVRYDTDDNSFEVLNTTSDFPTNKIDYVKWSSKNEELYFSNYDPKPYHKNESIIPYAYSYSAEAGVYPIGNRFQERTFNYILINDTYVIGNDGRILIINNSISNFDNSIRNVYPVFYPAKASILTGPYINDMIIVDNYLYEVGDIYMTGGSKPVHSEIYKTNLKNISFREGGHVDKHELLLRGDDSGASSIVYNPGEHLFYVGTKNGVLQVDPHTLEVSMNITKIDGIISNNITSLSYSAKDNLLFIGTDMGLSIYNTTSEEIININKSQGILDNNINCIDYDNSEDKIYIGHDNGISIFKIKDITDLPKIQHTPLTQATVGKPIPITATITDSSNISSALVYYRPTDQANFTSIEMQADGDDYTAQIPSTPTPGKLEYYIEASDIYGNENQTKVYEVDVVEENTSTQGKDGYIPGTDMTSSVIITAIILLLAILIVIFSSLIKKENNR